MSFILNNNKSNIDTSPPNNAFTQLWFLTFIIILLNKSNVKKKIMLVVLAGKVLETFFITSLYLFLWNQKYPCHRKFGNGVKYV